MQITQWISLIDTKRQNAFLGAGSMSKLEKLSLEIPINIDFQLIRGNNLKLDSIYCKSKFKHSWNFSPKKIILRALDISHEKKYSQKYFSKNASQVIKMTQESTK